MNITPSQIPEVLIIKPDIFIDERGWFSESYNKKVFNLNIDFIQDNHSMSKQKNTLRGLHFQNNPYAQSKLIRCTKGRVLDVAVDLRKKSKTFKRWVSVELSEENHLQLFIPKGFAHGFLTLTDNTEFQYKVDQYYNKEHDRVIRFDDPEIGIDWEISNPILSKKDKDAPLLKDSDCNF